MRPRQFVTILCPSCGRKLDAEVRQIQVAVTEAVETVNVEVVMFPVRHKCPDPTVDQIR